MPLSSSAAKTFQEEPSSSRRGPLRAKTAWAEQYLGELLDRVDVRIDGGRPWEPVIHDRRLFDRVLAGGSLALGESYMAGAWDCDRLDEFFRRLLSGRLHEKVGKSLQEVWMALSAKAKNLQRGRRAYVVGRRHYDLGNSFFQGMLDSRMVYSCAYWKEAASLEEAQCAKLDLICRKIGLRKGQRLLDIGCGWGSLAGFAAEKYGARVVGVTVSEEQARYANERYKKLPVQIVVQDYREMSGVFDHIVSVGMFEHVGLKNYRAFMEVVDRCLRPEGVFLLHTIGRNETAAMLDPWIVKYIFPNSTLPSAARIAAAAEGLFAIRDWHSFGPHYDLTLLAWHENFQRNWRRIKEGLDEQFRRMWRYYLLQSAGAFRADWNQLWQIVFSKPGEGARCERTR